MSDTDLEPLWNVVEEHLDEAEFLWGMWERSLVAPNYTLDDVAEGPEERLLAHIDGLVVTGPLAARKLLIPALEDEEPERVSAAATALLLGGRASGGVDAVFEAMRDLPEQRPPLVRALCCADVPEVLTRTRALLLDEDSGLVAAAAEVLAFHFQALGETLGLLLASEEVAARVVALRAIANEPEPGRYIRAVQAACSDADPRIAEAAIEAGVRLGLEAAWARAREHAHGMGGGESMLFLALRGEAADQSLLINALADRKRRLSALWALGFLGTPEAVDASLEWLEDKAAGPLAGEVFSAVTGMDIEDAKMSLPYDNDEEALEWRPEDDLPRPNPMRVLQHWMKLRADFPAGHRYVRGEVCSPAQLLAALAGGQMRRRPAHLLDLELQTAAKVRPRLQVRAPTSRQRVQLVQCDRSARAAR